MIKEASNAWNAWRKVLPGKDALLVVLWVILGVLAAFLEFLTGPYVQFPFFFLAPVALASWFSGRAAGLILAVALPLARPVYYLEFWDSQYSLFSVFLNPFIKIFVFSVFAELIHRVAAASRFRAQILACLPLGLWVADRNGSIIQSNPAGRAIWGGEPICGRLEESEVKLRWHASGEEVDPYDWALICAVRDGKTSLNEVLEIERPDGTRRIILNSATPVQDDQGRISGAVLINQDITEAKQMEKEREALIRSLEEARKNIKILSGLLPVCANCKKIRDDEGSWKQMEEYIQSHSEAEFTHGICPECIKHHYPEFAG